MIRWLLIVFVASLAVSVACLGAAATLGDVDSHVRLGPSAGPQVTRDMGWPGTEDLSIAVPAEITYVQGPAARMTVTGPKDEVDTLTLTDGRLAAGDEERGRWLFFAGSRRRSGRLAVSVTGPSTRHFHLTGAKLDIESYDQDSLEVAISGAADVKAAGRTQRADLRIAGAGSLDLAQLAMDDATVAISGAGDATLGPKLSADISISGVGHVKLLTRPANLHTHVSGVGSITQP
jgi:hypothetical protein